MDQGIEYLEQEIEFIDSGITPILDKYRELYPPPGRPLWHLIEDIQRQAMVYTNIIDQLKSGKTAAEIKERFDELDLVLPTTLPNPIGTRLLAYAFDKVSQFRKALVEIVRGHGRELLSELGFELQLTYTYSVGVDLGLPPAVTLAVDYTAGN